jgi:hypothetical protein
VNTDSRLNTDRRRRAYRFGHWAETLCVWWLRLGGYRVLARRYKTPVGEIDIVARRGAALAFIEVKARRHTTRDDGGEVLDHAPTRPHYPRRRGLRRPPAGPWPLRHALRPDDGCAVAAAASFERCLATGLTD